MENHKFRPSAYKAEITDRERRTAQRLFNIVKRSHKHIAGMANVLHHMGTLFVKYAEDLDRAHQDARRDVRVDNGANVGTG